MRQNAELYRKILEVAESLDGSAYVRVDPDDCPGFPRRGLQVVGGRDGGVGRDGEHIRRAEPLLRAAYSARLLGAGRVGLGEQKSGHPHGPRCEGR